MKREFFINIAFLVFINLLIKPFYIFGIDRGVQNLVGPEAYGLYFALFNFTFLLQIVNDFGIQNFNNRNIARHRHLLGKYFPALLLLKAGLAVIYLCGVSVAALVAGYGPEVFPLLLVVAVNWILLSMVLFLRSNISGLGLYRLDSLLSVLDRTLLIIICGVLLWTPSLRVHFRIEWFIYAQTCTLVLTVLSALFVIGRRAVRWHFRLKPVLLLLLLKQSYPYALVIFLMTAYTRIDGVMIERMLPAGAVEAGVYAMAYRLLDAASIFGFLFAGLLLPMFSRQLSEGVSVGPLVRFSFQLIWAGGVALAAAVFFFRGEIMGGLYTYGGSNGGEVLGYLMLSFPAICGSYIYGTLLTANGSMMRMNVLFLAGVIINVGLNAWLIPLRGASGAAVATLATQYLVWLAQAELARRELGLARVPGLIARVLGFAILSAVTAYIFTLISIPWLGGFLASMVFAGLWALGLKLVHWRETWQLLRAG